MPAEMEGKEDPLVPKDVDFRPPVIGMDRIDRRISEVDPVVEGPHPTTDDRGSCQRRGTDGQWRGDLHARNPFLMSLEGRVLRRVPSS